MKNTSKTPVYHVRWNDEETVLYAWPAKRVSKAAITDGRIMTDDQIDALSAEGVYIAKGSSFRDAQATYVADRRGRVFDADVYVRRFA